jgi:hypothetical protein
LSNQSLDGREISQGLEDPKVKEVDGFIKWIRNSLENPVDIRQKEATMRDVRIEIFCAFRMMIK